MKKRLLLLLIPLLLLTVAAVAIFVTTPCIFGHDIATVAGTPARKSTIFLIISFTSH